MDSVRTPPEAHTSAEVLDPTNSPPAIAVVAPVGRLHNLLRKQHSQQDDQYHHLRGQKALPASPATLSPATALSADTDELVYEAIEQVRRWKERPNQTRITGYLRKRHKVDQATTERILDDMVRRKRICRVWYMDDVTYRSLEQHRRCPRGSPLSASPSGSTADQAGEENADEDGDSACDNDQNSDYDENIYKNYQTTVAPDRGKATNVGRRNKIGRHGSDSLLLSHIKSSKSLSTKKTLGCMQNTKKLYGTDCQTPPLPPPQSTHFDMNEEDLSQWARHGTVKDDAVGDSPDTTGPNDSQPRPQMRDQGVQSGEFDGTEVVAKSSVQTGYFSAAANGSYSSSSAEQHFAQSTGQSNVANVVNPRGKLRPLGPKPPQHTRQSATSPLLDKNQKLEAQQQVVPGAHATATNGQTTPRVKRKYCRRLIPSSLGFGVVQQSSPNAVAGRQSQVSSIHRQTSSLCASTPTKKKKRKMKGKKGKKQVTQDVKKRPSETDGNTKSRKYLRNCTEADSNQSKSKSVPESADPPQNRPLSAHKTKFPPKFGVLNQLRRSYASDAPLSDSVLFPSLSELDQHARYLSAYERRVATFLNSRRNAALDRSWQMIFGVSTNDNTAANVPRPLAAGVVNLLGRRNCSKKCDEACASPVANDKRGDPFLQKHSM